ncbi:hypothetical protein D3C85_1772300 [compost metagenome]
MMASAIGTGKPQMIVSPLSTNVLRMISSVCACLNSVSKFAMPTHGLFRIPSVKL